MRIVLPTEVYPPRAGGAGWSTRALARGLKRAGHVVRVITTSPGPTADGDVPVDRIVATGRRRFTVPRAIARALRDEIEAGAVVHAQHSLSALGALAAGAPGRVAVTVRDHWPVCFWSTRISRGSLCPRCTLGNMTRCVDGHVPLPRPLSLAAIPYMRGDLAAKRKALHRAGAVLAVSEAIAAELRAAGLDGVEIVPNIVDATETRRIAADPPGLELPDRFLLFIGKLEENKGVRLLVPAVAASGARLPLVVLGEGSLLQEMKFDAASRGVELLTRGWVHREDVLRSLARATALVFPSLWPEPLSRVLLEALSLGVPIAAMDTGGTREILEDGRSGLIVSGEAGLADAVARIVDDASLRAHLIEGARESSRAFSPEVLVPRYEGVYRRLM